MHIPPRLTIRNTLLLLWFFTVLAGFNTALINHFPASAQPVSNWQPPIAGPLRIGATFAPPAQNWNRGHRGVDLCPGVGAPIYAPTAGQVIYAGKLNNRNLVSIRTPSGIKTSFEPLQVSVKVNQVVAAGQLLGHLEVGHESNGKVTNCLHWGVRNEAGKYLNPLQFLVGPVRLLPWSTPPLN